MSRSQLSSLSAVLRSDPSVFDGEASTGSSKDFRVRFHVVLDPSSASSVQSFDMDVHPHWAPTGATRFKDLVESRYFSGVRFSRVIAGFMVQFGLSG